MRPSVPIPCLIVLGLTALAGSAAAQTPAKPTRFGLSASIGLFVPRDSTMTAVYGTVLTPVAAQIDVAIWRWFSVVGGVRWLPATGAAVPLDGNGPLVTERFSTSLAVRTFHVAFMASARVAPRWTLGGGGGVGTSSYKESMPDTSLETSGHTTGMFGVAEVRYTVGSAWSLVGRFAYFSMPVDVVNAAHTLNIGGPDVQIGLRYAF